MREIKFRAWDNQRKEFLSGGQILIAVKSGRNPKENPQYLDVIKDASMYKARFELMQYTGFKDKNGREIYEGDVIEKNYKNMLTGDMVSEIYSVVFDEGIFIAKYEKSSPFGDTLLKFLVGGVNERISVKIIGNIYENPELLEATK